MANYSTTVYSEHHKAAKPMNFLYSQAKTMYESGSHHQIVPVAEKLWSCAAS